jgi:hypothetical protein
LTLTAYPCKLSPEEFEARLSGSTLPLPGQVLRLVAPVPVYVQVISIQSDRQRPSSVEEGLVRCRLLHGRPSLAPVQAEILTPAALRQAAQMLQAECNNPLQLGPLGTFDFLRLGALNVIYGDAFSNQYDALMILMEGIRPYQQILVLDPLGLASAGGSNSQCLHAGEDFRLSLQAVGSKQFLDNFAQLLPESLQEAGLRTLANLLPTSMQSFVGFQSLFALESLAEAPLRNLILQNLHTMAQARLFADTPQEVFSLETSLPQRITILDLSGLTEPWKRLFYTELCRHAIRMAGGDVVLALIHPEHYLNELPVWFRQADEAELTVLALASPYQNSGVKKESAMGKPVAQQNDYAIASNQIWVEANGHLLLQGRLTVGLPVQAALVNDGADATELLTESLLFQRPTLSSTSDGPDPLEADFFEESVISEQNEQGLAPTITMEDVLQDDNEGGLNENPDSGQSITMMSVETVSALAPLAENSEKGFESEGLAFGEDMAGGASQLEIEADSKPPETPLPELPPVDESIVETETGAFDEPGAVIEPLPLDDSQTLNDESESQFDAEETGLLFDNEQGRIIEDSAESDAFLEGATSLVDGVDEDDDEEEDWLPDFDASLIPGGLDPMGTSTLFPGTLGSDSNESEFLEEEDALFFDFDPDLGNDRLSIGSEGVDRAESTGPLQSPPMPEELRYEDDEEAPASSASVDSVPAPPFVDETPPIHQRETHLLHQTLPESLYQPGDRVQHPTYGAGTVMKVLPMAEQVILNISFDRVGKRLLDPTLCQLTREGEVAS